MARLRSIAIFLAIAGVLVLIAELVLIASSRPPAPCVIPSDRRQSENTSSPLPSWCTRGPSIPTSGDVLHVVSMTHWDREWYHPQEIFRSKLLHVIDEVLATIESGAEADTFGQFLLDGQTLPIEDYLESRPESAKSRVSDACRCGKLRLGPWFVQPDEFLSTGECLVRNLLEGTKRAERIGGGAPPLRVGYLPDTFGHAGQVPQILTGFAIGAAAFARGVPDSANAGMEALWESPDGSSVMAIVQHSFYCNSGGSPDHPDDTPGWFAKKRQWAKELSATRHMLLMNGCDHVGFDPYILQNIRIVSTEPRPAGLVGATVVHSSLERYVESVKEEMRLPAPSVARLEGELRSGVEGLAATLSTRPHQKRLSWTCSQLIQRWAEPFSSISWAAFGREYETERIARGWRFLLESMPHDSAAGCVVDAVADEVTMRLERCTQSMSQLTSEIFQSIVARLNFTSPAPADAFAVVFNPLSWQISGSLVVAEIVLPTKDVNRLWYQRSAIKAVISDSTSGKAVPSAAISKPKIVWDYTLPDYEFRKHFNVQRIVVAFLAQVPPLGWATFSIRIEPDGIDEAQNETEKKPGSCANGRPVLASVWNGIVQAEVAQDCSLWLRFESECFEGVGLLTSEEEAGDAYKHYGGFSNVGWNGSVALVERNDAFSRVVCDVQLDRFPQLRVQYVLPRGSAIVHSLVDEIGPNGGDRGPHRIQSRFPLGARATSILSDGQFDLVARPPNQGIQPFESLLAMATDDMHRGLVIAARGMHEHEAHESDGLTSIAVTLSRTTVEIDDWARFDARGLLENFAHSFELAVAPAADRPTFDRAIVLAREFITPAAAVQGRTFAGVVGSKPLIDPLRASELRMISDPETGASKYQQMSGTDPEQYIGIPRAQVARPALPHRFSLGSLSPVPELHIDALKMSEAGGQLVMRFHSISHSDVAAALSLDIASSVQSCSVDEKRCRPLSEIRGETGSVHLNFTVPKKKIVSIAIQKK